MHKGIPFVGQEITQSRDFAEAFENFHWSVILKMHVIIEFVISISVAISIERDSILSPQHTAIGRCLWGSLFAHVRTSTSRLSSRLPSVKSL